MKFIIHMHVKENQPILVRVLQAYQTFSFFFTWNFVNHLKQTFLQTSFSLLAVIEPIKIQRRLIDLSKTEKRVCSQRPAAHVLSIFLYMIGLFVRPQTQRERMQFDFQQPLVQPVNRPLVERGTREREKRKGLQTNIWDCRSTGPAVHQILMQVLIDENTDC